MDAEKMARDVAKELRKRGIWADINTIGPVIRIPVPTHSANEYLAAYRVRAIVLHDSHFDNLTAFEIADEIQAQEAKRAQEWAGDA